MYRKKRKNRQHLLLITLFIVLFLTIIVIYIMNTKRNLNPVEKVIKDTVLTAGNVIYKPINFINNKIKENKEKNNLYKKYKKLENEYNDIKHYEEEIDNLKKENEELRKQLSLGETLLDYEKINASVVNRNIGYFYDSFTINKGTSNGVEVGDAVVTSDGLIGKVVSASNLYSTVSLLTSSKLDQKISVRIKIGDGKYVYGLLSGYDKEKNAFYIEGISENVQIEKGCTVKTTGMSDIFPGGILIGYVEKVEKDNFDLTMIVYAEPSSDFDDLDFVAVLKRKIDINE